MTMETCGVHSSLRPDVSLHSCTCAPVHAEMAMEATGPPSLVSKKEYGSSDRFPGNNTCVFRV